ncbi:DNA-binding transcriptional regulator, LysR family [Cohaesibacter marisflavi]|uniref:DNA-binding transcriptional regulator, LysR family n=1 Tax=Cohaesibacter marisflavi TaxID=655353 RepID=A0A1I5G547_9HYPH|nr:LysR family transcriptional regulator [Cohaesibacter marisflavi]SFO31112.1 DNA-binding transcriptional regulator, LysR family [Cohaesibacter marisflavi]
MAKPSYDDLSVFLAVDREGNFTRAAAKLGVSPSAVSQTIRGLEEQLGVRLLTRSTRSVTRTEAGDKLLARLAPMYDEMDMLLAEVSSLREKPAGTVRITADEIAIEQVLWPKLKKVLDDYPEITVELMTDYGLTDIVAERFDAGVRLGELIASDMIAVPIAPEMRMTVVAAPRYLDTHQKPTHPHDLTRHICINLRLPTHGGLFAWEFSENGQEFRIRVEGQLVFNSVGQILQATLDGYGLAQMPLCQVEPHLQNGTLVEVLQDWSEPFAGYHLYYPSRRQQTAAFRVVVEALRHHS